MAAVWLNTWITIVSVIGWVVGALVATRTDGGWWVTVGAVGLAVAVPIAAYPTAKLFMVGLLLRLDPPSDGASP